MRDYLVFVRAGRNSLHTAMLADEPDRNWDCYVNAWADPDSTTAEQEGVEVYAGGGINKFEAFADAFEANAHAFPYRFVLMIDDDLRFKKGDVSRFFELCEREKLYLTQPAIAWGSHANHIVNIANPVCTVRQVNFVEVMAPCLSSAAVEALLPTFRLTRCTWGIDYAWGSLLEGQGRQTVVDAVTMQHTKPMDRSGGPFYDMLRRRGIEPEEELAEVQRRYPGFGPFRTLPDGHRYRWPMAQHTNARLAAWMEERKLDFHLRRGGTLVPPAAEPLASAA